MRVALLVPLAAFAVACAPAPAPASPGVEVDVGAPTPPASAEPVASSAPPVSEDDVDEAEAADAEAAFRATEQAEQRQKLEALIASGALEPGQGPTGAGFGKVGGPAGGAGAVGLGTAQPSTSGALSKDAIKGVVQANVPAIKACYDRFLGTEPTLTGRVVLRFVIEGDGRVGAASVASSTLGHAKIEACLVGVAQAWRFPAPQGGGKVIVNYPFFFQPSSDGPSGGSAPLTPGPSGP